MLAATVAGLLGVAAFHDAPRRPVYVPDPIRVREGARIVYPADRQPTLRLSDGQRKAVRSMLNIPKPMRFGDHVWNDADIPRGPVWVRIDLSRQIISVFRAGHEIGSAVILYGTDGKPTPTGVFHVLARARAHRSNLYDAEMPYMLRLTNDGVAIHASNVKKGSATHGCVGVPRDFAQLLFDVIQRGDMVAIERGMASHGLASDELSAVLPSRSRTS